MLNKVISKGMLPKLIAFSIVLYTVLFLIDCFAFANPVAGPAFSHISPAQSSEVRHNKLFDPGLFLLVVFISIVETAVFISINKVAWKRTFWSFLIVNIASTIFGDLIFVQESADSICYGIFLPIAAIFILSVALKGKLFPLWYSAIGFLAVFISAVILLAYHREFFIYGLSQHDDMNFIFPISFGATLIYEGLPFALLLEGGRKWQGVLASNAASYALLFLIIYAFRIQF